MILHISGPHRGNTFSKSLEFSAQHTMRKSTAAPVVRLAYKLPARTSARLIL